MIRYPTEMAFIHMTKDFRVAEPSGHFPVFISFELSGAEAELRVSGSTSLLSLQNGASGKKPSQGSIQQE